MLTIKRPLSLNFLGVNGVGHLFFSRLRHSNPAVSQKILAPVLFPEPKGVERLSTDTLLIFFHESGSHVTIPSRVHSIVLERSASSPL